MTGRDVARAAGVSQAAVSLVMTGKSDGRISDERARLGAAHRAGARLPAQCARAQPASRAHPRIALVVPNVANRFFSSVLLGAERAARARGNAVMLLDIGDDPDWIDWLANIMSARAVDGCIVYAADPVPSRDVQRLGANVVLVEAHASHAASIELDIYGGAHRAMEHLVSLGHRHIAHLRANFAQETFHARRSAYLAAMDEAGLPLDPQGQVTSRFDIESSSRAAGQLLDIEHRPTANPL